jgi:maltooligosyltrehalose trehalohydrolase
VEKLGAALARRLVLIAESDLNDPRLVTPREAGGLGMDAQWSDDFHHALFALLSREEQKGYYADFGSLSHLAKALERTYVYDGNYSRYRKRVHGRPAGSLSQHRFLGYIQNHDQVGNRAKGDRISEVAGFDRAKIAAAVVLMAPFIPMVFQGEEWAASSPFQYFADHDDPVMAQLVAEERKKEFSAFGWDSDSIPKPESPETFERSKLNWDEINQREHAEMLAWYRKLIRLRRTAPCLNDGEAGHNRVFYDQQEMWFCMKRGQVTVSSNLGASDHSFAVPEGSQMLLASRAALSVNHQAMTLPPDTIAVFSDTQSWGEREL